MTMLQILYGIAFGLFFIFLQIPHDFDTFYGTIYMYIHYRYRFFMILLQMQYDNIAAFIFYCCAHSPRNCYTFYINCYRFFLLLQILYGIATVYDTATGSSLCCYRISMKLLHILCIKVCNIATNF